MWRESPVLPQVFCLVLPGDAASTRRFSEIMTAGCIPVFIGPPYHSMPLIHDVDYRNAAVFFSIQNHSPWMNAKMEVRTAQLAFSDWSSGT